MSLMRPVHAWELDRIANEEDRKIISDKVPISLLGKHLDCEATNVRHSIRRALFYRNSR